MIKRRFGQNITLDTRADSNETVNKQKRYGQIIECLHVCPQLTAKEIAVMMLQKGYIPTDERNFTAPRLTEMCKMGVVDTVGKKKCLYTGKTVTVYELRNAEE